MSFELDHVLICAPVGALIADQLVEAGFAEGTPNRHSGQGTANRRFFFGNAFLEFIWVEDEAEIRSDLVAPTRLWERMIWRESGASPFEICIRPVGDPPGEIPFSTFSYRPPYLPPGDEIPMADRVPIEEPGSFVNLAGMAPSRNLANEQPLEHPNGARIIEGIRLSMPAPTSSEVSHALTDLGIARYQNGKEHTLEIDFGGSTGSNSLNLRPELPLKLIW
jgi:Glyoxalase-like domain